MFAKLYEVREELAKLELDTLVDKVEEVLKDLIRRDLKIADMASIKLGETHGLAKPVLHAA